MVLGRIACGLRATAQRVGSVTLGTLSVSRQPRWTPQNRPLVDGSRPATTVGPKRVEVYRVAGSCCKSEWVLVRQLRGPPLEDVAVVEEPVEEGGHGGGVSEELAPGRFEVKRVEARS